ncbi:MAG: recO [Anaerosporomusa subterranea]|jgi:DNA repair protein RecO (recombination protein O)|nr:recO [Anaerosporomusa subterranea]
MKQYQAEAIVLGIRDWQGADKIVTLFTREFGKITALAFGLRQARNQLSGCIQLFSHIDVVLGTGKNLDVLRQASLKESNRVLREDLDRMAYSALVVEAAAELWPERESQSEAFDTLCSALHLLSERNPRIAALAVCWQLLSLAGYQPEFDHCVICGDDQCLLPAFDPEAGGVSCPSCRQLDHLSLSESSCVLLKRLFTLNLLEPEHFTTSAGAVAEVENLLLHFLAHRLDKQLHSISFIRSLSNLG